MIIVFKNKIVHLSLCLPIINTFFTPNQLFIFHSVNLLPELHHNCLLFIQAQLTEGVEEDRSLRLLEIIQVRGFIFVLYLGKLQCYTISKIYIYIYTFNGTAHTHIQICRKLIGMHTFLNQTIFGIWHTFFFFFSEIQNVQFLFSTPIYMYKLHNTVCLPLFQCLILLNLFIGGAFK